MNEYTVYFICTKQEPGRLFEMPSWARTEQAARRKALKKLRTTSICGGTHTILEVRKEETE